MQLVASEVSADYYLHSIISLTDLTEILSLWLKTNKLLLKVTLGCKHLKTSYFVSFLSFYILATSKVIPRQEPTCDGVHSWQPYSAAPLGDHTTSTMTQYHTQSHYPATVLINPCPNLILSY